MPTTSITKRVEKARKIMAQLKELDKVNAALYWHRAQQIHGLRKDNLWKYVYGEDGATWSNFVVNELKTPYSSAMQKEAAYAFFVKKHSFTVNQLQPYDAYALYYIASLKTDAAKAEVETWMQKSLHVNRKDFINEIRGKDCGHEHVHIEEEKKQVCDACHKVVMKLKDGKKKK